jgi:hypothetical protein
MPILGVVASSISGNLYNASYESISTVTVGAGGVSSVTFSSIPQTYTHLQVRMIARTNRALSDVDAAILRYNSDTNSNNYTYHEIVGSGSAVSVYGSGAPEAVQMYSTTGATALANAFGVGITDILDYSNTNKYKTQRNFGGHDTNGSGQIRINSGLWINTNAISSMTFTPASGTLFNQYTQFALYGINGVA